MILKPFAHFIPKGQKETNNNSIGGDNINELSKEELIATLEDIFNESNEYFVDEEGIAYDPYIDIRIAMVKHGIFLDRLINDRDGLVREAVANQGYGLDKLINDDDWMVRYAVASQGYGLDKLVNDKNAEVRKLAKANINNK